MIGHIIAALIGNYMTTCFVIGLLVALVHALRLRGTRSSAAVSGGFVNAYMLWAVGIAQIINFVMHSVFGDYAAKTIGWAQSPFQLELAFSSLGLGVMAVILSGHRTQLRAKVAMILAVAIFAFGAAGGHVYQMVVNADYAADNTGLLLFMDIFIAVAGLGLAIWHTIASRHTDPTPNPTISSTDAAVVTDQRSLARANR